MYWTYKAVDMAVSMLTAIMLSLSRRMTITVIAVNMIMIAHDKNTHKQSLFVNENSS